MPRENTGCSVKRESTVGRGEPEMASGRSMEQSTAEHKTGGMGRQRTGMFRGTKAEHSKGEDRGRGDGK